MYACVHIWKYEAMKCASVHIEQVGIFVCTYRTLTELNIRHHYLYDKDTRSS